MRSHTLDPTRSILLSLALAATVFSGCTNTAVGPEEDYPFLANAVGTVTLPGPDQPYVIEVEKPRQAVVFADPALPAQFRQDGLPSRV